ncbi:hypothetical protein OTU49_013143, partial [Cherax quadricarinatus]
DSVWVVSLTDSTGRPLEGHSVGPLTDGASVSLACQANHGSSEVVSLAWLLEGDEVDVSWATAEKGVAINQLTLSNLHQEHRNAHLTCRLTALDPDHPYVAFNLTDASTFITMY